MKRFFFLMLFLSSFFLPFVFAEDVSTYSAGYNCEASSVLSEFALSNPSYYALSAPASQTVTYTGCSIISDRTIFTGDIELSLTQGSTAVHLKTEKEVQGNLFGFTVDLPMGTIITFDQNRGAIVTLPQGTQATLFDVSQTGLVVSAVSGSGTFSLKSNDYVSVTARLPTLGRNAVVSAMDIILQNDTLQVSSKYGYYQAIINSYFLSLNTDDEAGTDIVSSSGDDLLLLMNKQQTCSSSVAKQLSLPYALIDEKGIEQNSYNFFSDQITCNTEVLLANKNDLSYSTDMRLIPDEDHFSFTFQRTDDNLDDHFVLNKGDMLTLLHSGNSYSGNIDVAQPSQDSQAVPLVLCGQAQYSAGSGTHSGGDLSGDSSFSFLLGDTSSDSCTMTSCVYSGVQTGAGSTGQLTLWCGNEYPQFVVTNTKNVEGLSYADGIWTCLKGNCFTSSIVKFIPIQGAPSIGLVTNAFKSYTFDAVSNTGELDATHFYIGDTQEYLVRPKDALARFSEGSLRVELADGSLLSYRTNQKFDFSGSKTVPFLLGFTNDAAGFTSLSYVSCCGVVGTYTQGMVYGCSLSDSKGVPASSQIASLTKESFSFSTTGCDVAPQKASPLDNPAPSEPVTVASINGSSSLTVASDVTSGKAEVADVLATGGTGFSPPGNLEPFSCHSSTVAEPWQGTCQCGRRDSLDSQKKIVQPSDQGGLWTSAECTSDGECSVTGCGTGDFAEPGEDIFFYCCSDTTAAKKPNAWKSASLTSPFYALFGNDPYQWGIDVTSSARSAEREYDTPSYANLGAPCSEEGMYTCASGEIPRSSGEVKNVGSLVCQNGAWVDAQICSLDGSSVCDPFTCTSSGCGCATATCGVCPIDTGKTYQVYASLEKKALYYHEDLPDYYTSYLVNSQSGSDLLTSGYCSSKDYVVYCDKSSFIGALSAPDTSVVENHSPVQPQNSQTFWSWLIHYTK